MEGRDSIRAAGHGAGHKARGQAEAPGRVRGDGCEASLVFFPTLCLNLPLRRHNSPFLLRHTHGGLLRSSVRGTNLTADSATSSTSSRKDSRDTQLVTSVFGEHLFHCQNRSDP